MKKMSMKWTLVLMVVGSSLLAACAPAPAATQDPALVQQLIEQSVALTVVAQNVQVTDSHASLVAAAPAFTPTDESAVLPGGSDLTTSTAESAMLPGGSDSTTSESVPLPAVSDVTETPTPIPASCLARKVDPILPSQLNIGSTAVIRHPLNLRTGPSSLKRILMVLDPDTQVEIINGPAKQRFSEGGDYYWWQVELPGGLTGWSAEVSACHEFYFMEPVK